MSEPTVLTATVATVDPAALSCMVTISAWDGGTNRHGPARYVVQGATTHPMRGDPCTVVVDERGGIAVAAWSPSVALPPGPDPGPGGGSDLRWVQSIPTATWVIPWPDDRVVPPRVTTVIDGAEVYGDVAYDEALRRVTVTFDGAATGVAFLT